MLQVCQRQTVVRGDLRERDRILAGSPSQLQWLSSNNNVATVSATGLVTARTVGTATITVRFAADTTNAASSNISVTQ